MRTDEGPLFGRLGSNKKTDWTTKNGNKKTAKMMISGDISWDKTRSMDVFHPRKPAGTLVLALNMEVSCKMSVNQCWELKCLTRFGKYSYWVPQF